MKPAFEGDISSSEHSVGPALGRPQGLGAIAMAWPPLENDGAAGSRVKSPRMD